MKVMLVNGSPHKEGSTYHCLVEIQNTLREEGIASFRIRSYGDISHLHVADEEPSKMARFCECFTDDDRHEF